MPNTHAMMIGFAEELAVIGGLEKTADWDNAIKGLIVGGLLGGGAGFAGAKGLAYMIERNKKFAAMMGAALGASLGIAGGSLTRGAPGAPTTVQEGIYRGIPVGTRYGDIE